MITKNDNTEMITEKNDMENMITGKILKKLEQKSNDIEKNDNKK